MKARMTINRDFTIGAVDKRIFGSFIEHLGRAVYGGIYEPGHPQAGKDGLRQDVLRLVRELDVPIVRYPGGNFVSAFKWEDSVGPVSDRPRRLDLAWRAVEPNVFGLNEFMSWCKAAGTAPMMALNLGTRGVDAARNLVEYCNHPEGSYWSDLRKSHGAKAPHDIRLWCLGNEMDGPWQVGQKTPDEYGRIAYETAKALKLFDPGLELVACGSSSGKMPSFPQWEATVLDHCYDKVDYLSLHQYYANHENDIGTFLAASRGMDRFIETVVATCDFVQAKKREKKKMMLSFDEWNVWFHSNDQDSRLEPWTVGPPQLEDVYTFEDALVVGCMMNSLLRHADRVKIACMAQLVNVIAPIMTRNGGGAWKQTIFWPLYHASRYARGVSLDLRVQVGTYENKTWGDTPWLDAVAVAVPAEAQAIRGETLDADYDGAWELAVFLVNRHQTESLDLEVPCEGFGALVTVEAIELVHTDLKAVNTETDPDRVSPRKRTSPRVDEKGFTLQVPPLSWTMVRLANRSEA